MFPGVLERVAVELPAQEVSTGDEVPRPVEMTLHHGDDFAVRIKERDRHDGGRIVLGVCGKNELAGKVQFDAFRGKERGADSAQVNGAIGTSSSAGGASREDCEKSDDRELHGLNWRSS